MIFKWKKCSWLVCSLGTFRDPWTNDPTVTWSINYNYYDREMKRKGRFAWHLRWSSQLFLHDLNHDCTYFIFLKINMIWNNLNASQSFKMYDRMYFFLPSYRWMYLKWLWFDLGIYIYFYHFCIYSSSELGK